MFLKRGYIPPGCIYTLIRYAVVKKHVNITINNVWLWLLAPVRSESGLLSLQVSSNCKCQLCFIFTHLNLKYTLYFLLLFINILNSETKHIQDRETIFLIEGHVYSVVFAFKVFKPIIMYDGRQVHTLPVGETL